MEKINEDKRNVLKKTLAGLGMLTYFGIAPISAMNNISKPKNAEKIIKDEHGRIVEIKMDDKIYKFNPENPMEYSVK